MKRCEIYQYWTTLRPRKNKFLFRKSNVNHQGCELELLKNLKFFSNSNNFTRIVQICLRLITNRLRILGFSAPLKAIITVLKRFNVVNFLPIRRWWATV